LALTAAQIVSLATQIARVPGFTAQAGQFLNMVLSDLCQIYDFEEALGTSSIAITLAGGSGPYNLPTDYLRMAGNQVKFSVGGVPTSLTNIELNEFDASSQAGGVAGLPAFFATNRALSPPAIYVYPPPAGNQTLNIRYYRQMADITTPESSGSVPWFDNQSYLVTRVAGELMRIAGDDRAAAYLGDGPDGAQGILKRYIELQADDEGRWPMGRIQKMQKV